MSETVSIVTAFVDIGRDSWEGEKNNQLIPHYIKRDVDTYFQRFERLAKLKNPITVFTETKFLDRIKAIREDINVVDVGNLFEDHAHVIKEINGIQQNPHFIRFVTRPSAPEYWSPEYVAINFFKSHLVSYAVEEGMCSTNTSAWLDFGYCRDDTYCPPGMEWKFDTEGEINIFANSAYTHETPVFEMIRTGEVVIQGCHIVAPNEKWQVLKQLMNNSMTTLLNVGLIDDDQTMLLMAYRSAPHLFNLNPGNPNDWFTIFKDYNHD